jgi:endonuclease/exonuclease/phosphatase family metal-dependent hydrolase
MSHGRPRSLALLRLPLVSAGVLVVVPACGLTVLTYNVAGNGATDWSTNAPQVRAIGRQMAYLQPDVITFNEIPFSTTWQMTNFAAAFLPGYALATNSGTDGYVRSVILSRHPITRSQKWLDGVSLADFGYSGTFTRDLFEAEISVPGFARPLHVFTAHLKALSDADSAARRAAEAGAISNFLVTQFLPVKGDRPYILAGDLNEDLLRPPSTSLQPVQRLLAPGTGLFLTTPRNPQTGDERTLSIRTSLTVRFDYILPGGLLFSNILASQVFRSDQLQPLPAELDAADSRTASDHLPVLMVFANPYDPTFRLTGVQVKDAGVTLTWQAIPGRRYAVEQSAALAGWDPLATNLVASVTNMTFTATALPGARFFRVQLQP